MQSLRFTKRILAALVCFALLISYLPGMSFAAKAATEEDPVVSSAPASTATDATEAESDLLSTNLAYDEAHWDNKTGAGTGLTAEKTAECVYGSQSNASWAFKATAAANMNGVVAQIHLNESVDLTDSYLALDVKYVTSGPETTFGFLYRLHNTAWADVTNNAGVEAVAGEWTTVYLTPSAIAGMDLTDCKLLTFNFNFAGTAGAERAIYIDNARVVKIEKATEDWIKLPVDTGMSAGTVKVVNELTMGGTSTQAIKVVSGYGEAGSVCFNTAHAVDGKNADPVLPEDKRLPAYPVMKSGVLSGWFYFGEQTPSGTVALTYDDWGTSNAVEISFEPKGNGWYLGSIDCADFTTTTMESTEAVWRVDINGLPENATVYIDNLVFNDAPSAIEGLSIAYPFNSETYQQNATPANRFDALTFISAKNEVESAQMILTPDFDIASFELTMGDLYDNDGHIISADDFDVFIAHYVEVTDSNNGGAQATDPETGVTVWDGEALAAGANGVFPNQLVPQAAKIAAGENVVSAGNGQAIWVNLNVGTAAPGNYTGEAKLNINGTDMTIPVNVTVYDVALPEEVHTQSSFQIWWDQLEAGDGIERAHADRYYDYLVSKRIMPFDAWNIQRYPNALVERIVNQWAGDPAISAYSLHYTHEISDEFFWTDPAGIEKPYNEVVASSLVDMLQLLIDKNIELAEAGSDLDLFAKAYYYFGQVCDEPRNETEYALANDCIAKLDAAKETLAPQLDAYPELKASFMDIKAMFTTSNPLDKTYAFIGSYQDYGNVPLEGDSYAYCPQYQWLNSAEQRAMYENDESLWWYGCTHPVNPYPTLHFNSPLMTTRALGWMMYDYNIDGVLYWCVNSWYSYKDPDKTGLQTMWTNDDDGTPGEGTLVYPGSAYGITGPIGSIRIEAYRESMEDYEYLWLLDSLTGGADISAYTAGMYEGTIASTDPSIHHESRIALLENLETLNVAANGATEAPSDLNTLPVDPEQAAPEDLSLDMTNQAVTSDSTVSIDKEFFFPVESSQSMKVVGDAYGSPVIFDLSAKLPNMTMGGVSAYFYFGDAEPYAALSLIDDEYYDSSNHEDGAVPFTFEAVEDAEGWYYGLVDLTDIHFDEFDTEDGASADAITEMHIHVPAETEIHIDCLQIFNLEVEDFLSNATSTDMALQTEFTNDSITAWYGNLSSNDWAYAPTFTLAEEYDISNHTLIMDVYLSGQASGKRVQIAKINGEWDSTDSRAVPMDTWTTVKWDLSGRKADTM
ncbi:MAG: DUF4091 domain-containing protein, partial [Oscillospiraceae bacterium]|nr:DUF4091 domain-containing protein [Oscillospiraceae bacterium]